MKKLVLSLGFILVFTAHGYAQMGIFPTNPAWGVGNINNLLEAPPMRNHALEAMELQQLQQRAYEQGLEDGKKKGQNSLGVSDEVLIMWLLDQQRGRR